MEERVGLYWHRIITRLAEVRFPEATVSLAQIRAPLGIYFRALGGDPGLQIEAADATAWNARRNWLQRIAGSGGRVELAWMDRRTLRLPPQVALFADTALNRDLYYWLAALASSRLGEYQGWLVDNQALCLTALQRFPGLKARYRRLVDAHLQQRPDPGRLPAAEAPLERAIRQSLIQPGSMAQMPRSPRPPFPVPLWLHPDPPIAKIVDAEAPEDDKGLAAHRAEQTDEMARRQAQKVKEPKADQGLITIRMENILTWGEFQELDRATEEEEDLERASKLAKDIDHISVSRKNRSISAGLKFDLDLPAEAEDDLVLDSGLLLPEWDWRKGQLLPDHCRIHLLLSDKGRAAELPGHLRRTAKRLRQQFQALAPARTWNRGQPEGQEIDLDAYLRFASDRAAGSLAHGDNLYRRMDSGSRDLACLLMADLSLSTDTWINDQHRVIEVIRDSLFLFNESLMATGDPFAIYGFSSRKRDPVRVHQIKTFDEPGTAEVRGRIQAIKPGYYTRMGAAVRHASLELGKRSEGRRLLLLLTDGKPNDLDLYEGRYGIEDTRNAIQETRRQGLEPFCVTIDQKGSDYLPYLFGSEGYVVIRNPAELPARLPMLYARMTG